MWNECPLAIDHRFRSEWERQIDGHRPPAGRGGLAFASFGVGDNAFSAAGREGRRALLFLDQRALEEALREDAFLEWAQVHGSYYGTLRSEVDPHRRMGKLVILDIDVQGAAQVRRRYRDAVTIFLRSPSMDVDERRLRDRGTEDEAAIQERLATARRELEAADEYDYQIVNDDLEQTVEQFRAILKRYLKRDSNAG